MLQLGLTGLIAAGKSTVAELLAERGAEVIDCDQLAHEVTGPGTPGLAAIVERFGSAILTPEGALDRRAMAALVFSAPAELAALEAVVHPLVGQARLEQLAASTATVAVIEAIKLIEVGYHKQCDYLWVVTAAPEVRLARLLERRGMTRAEALRRFEAQGDDADKLALADVVIVNDGGLAELRRQVDRAWERCVGDT